MAITTIPLFAKLIIEVACAMPSGRKPITPFSEESLLQLFNRNLPENEREAVAKSLLDNKITVRYRFGHQSKRAEVLEALFQQVFAKQPLFAIQAFETAHPKQYPLFRQWKEVLLITVPKAASNITGNIFFQGVVDIVSIGYIFFKVLAAYVQMSHLINSSLPILINNTPIFIIKMGNSLMTSTEFLTNNIFIICISLAAAKRVIAALPPIPYVSQTVREVNPWALFTIIFFPQSTFSFLFGKALLCIDFVTQQCQNVSHLFSSIAENGENQKINACKGKVAAAWAEMISTL